MNIHYIWIDFKNEQNRSPSIPANFRRKIDNCARINPTFTVKLWNGYDCRQLLVEKFPQYLQLYDSMPYPIMRCDMIRYFILYEQGGFYLDCDRTCQLPFQELVKDSPDVLLGKKTYFMIDGVGNDFIYAKKGSDFMKYCFERIKLRKSFIHSLTVLRTAGPMFLTEQYENYRGPDKIKVLSKEVNGCGFCACDMDISQAYTYGDLSTTAWNDGLDRIYRKLYCNWFVILAVILIAYFIYKYWACRTGCAEACSINRYKRK